MEKSFGEQNFLNLCKNKNNKKKPKYSFHRNKCSLHKPLKQYIVSYINHNFNDLYMLENLSVPLIDTNTYTWWDCDPYKPKAY